MVALKSTGTNTFSAIRPYTDKDVYNELIKTQPFSWSKPYVGRLDLPSDICFQAENTLLYPLSANPAGSDIRCWQEKSSGDNRLSGWYAFVGGGTRMYDEDNLPECSLLSTQATCSQVAFCSWNATSSSCDEIPGIKDQLFQPYLLALDMGTGVNIFQYLWPSVQQAFAAKWPVSDIKGKNIPHSMTTPMVLDLWRGVASDDSRPLVGRDGLMDHIFVGDLAGHYWGIYLDDNPNTNTPRVFIDRWQTKKAYDGSCSSFSTQSACEATNACWWDSSAASPSCREGYGTRGPLQPVSADSAAAFDAKGNLRLFFGTGKFEKVTGDFNDRNDKGKNSFYNITLPLNQFTATGDTTCTASGYPSSPTLNCSSVNTLKIPDALYIRLQDNSCTDCSGTSDVWVDPPVSDTVKADYVRAGCGSASGTSCDCSTNCYQCIMDLTTPGEKVLGKPLVAGGLVFFTTYVPQASTCGAGGNSYLYVVDYMCRPLQSNPLRDAGLATTIYYSSDGSDMSAVRASLGEGMPSQPVLDSTGEHVLIQTSDAEIKRIKVELPSSDNFKGWHEEAMEE
jgi:type IV pilus assembly protein PilY1